jgi:hypothetical protein
VRNTSLCANMLDHLARHEVLFKRNVEVKSCHTGAIWSDIHVKISEASIKSFEVLAVVYTNVSDVVTWLFAIVSRLPDQFPNAVSWTHAVSTSLLKICSILQALISRGPTMAALVFAPFLPVTLRSTWWHAIALLNADLGYIALSMTGLPTRSAALILATTVIASTITIEILSFIYFFTTFKRFPLALFRLLHSLVFLISLLSFSCLFEGLPCRLIWCTRVSFMILFLVYALTVPSLFHDGAFIERVLVVGIFLEILNPNIVMAMLDQKYCMKQISAS